ncbi:hypothetical protein MKW98_011525 [Papaver atlanticum]|uniref:Uncharacterized protein n=1 Tax=Papaver atlanticum TaxID=357466 RepID=A0AAD4T3I1_9MAGN|nr:hypothetical protein MKW98_011525 [Papaver atlanticum]
MPLGYFAAPSSAIRDPCRHLFCMKLIKMLPRTPNWINMLTSSQKHGVPNCNPVLHPFKHSRESKKLQQGYSGVFYIHSSDMKSNYFCCQFGIR